MSIRIIEQSKECFTMYKSTPNFTLVFRWLSIQYFILHFSKIERWQYERDMIKYLTFCTNENWRFFLWFRWCVWHERSWWIHLTKWKLINYKQKIFLRKMYDIEYKTSKFDTCIEAKIVLHHYQAHYYHICWYSKCFLLLDI